ncbi:hypothetical protein Bca52824_092829 [Brassica carinata]|uniref:SNF2 N-terminal domain-containing protein n=1 Tax=Brassica carinata TaxID=52824 RepID=A0A8X7P3Q0_BRACI|nr:hypothetical protein Bca52824_092829 [Brassica carinata]
MSLSLHTTKIHFPPDCREFGITVTLKPHQVEGVSWLMYKYLLGVNVLLGYEFLQGLREPFCESESLLLFSVLFTTYDIALLDQDFLSQILWQYTVIDEAQILKNPNRLSRKRWE